MDRLPQGKHVINDETENEGFGDDERDDPSAAYRGLSRVDVGHVNSRERCGFSSAVAMKRLGHWKKFEAV